MPVRGMLEYIPLKHVKIPQILACSKGGARKITRIWHQVISFLCRWIVSMWLSGKIIAGPIWYLRSPKAPKFAHLHYEFAVNHLDRKSLQKHGSPCTEQKGNLLQRGSFQVIMLYHVHRSIGAQVRKRCTCAYFQSYSKNWARNGDNYYTKTIIRIAVLRWINIIISVAEL